MSILIEEWMIGGKLGLKGCELLVFAYAYSFYRDGKILFASEGNLGSLICYSRSRWVSPSTGSARKGCSYVRRANTPGIILTAIPSAKRD